MYEYHNNTLCVQVGKMIDAGIISESNYKYHKSKGHFVVVRRASYGNSALVEFISMPERFRKEVERIAGAPNYNQRKYFSDYLKPDPDALRFLKNYRNADDKPLTETLIEQYHAKIKVFNAIKQYIEENTIRQRALGKKDTALWKALAEAVHKLDKELYPHRLPKHYRRLKEKYTMYINTGYKAVIHKGVGNKNTEKLSGEAKVWLLQRWADPVNRCTSIPALFAEYNSTAKEKAWKPIKSEQTIHNYLDEVKHLWYASRYGEKRAKEQFSYHIGTKLPTMRDGLWYSDGTKLNLYYQDENGKIATINVYEVMDAYSELLLGFHISKTENYEAQFMAYKMAVKTSESRPYQISFDNQGGHKKLTTGNFLTKLAKLAIRTQPYNGKSKTIENAFGRFQSQVLKKRWFYTGGNITTKSIESKVNTEFILANPHKLPTLPELINEYKKAREEWNTMPHPRTGISRLEMYQNSINPETQKLSLLEMVDIFWIERPKTVKLSPYGLRIKENGVEKHYMKYKDDGITPDVAWLEKNVRKDFIVKYDPDDESLIYLYEKTADGDKRFVTALTPKIFVSRGKQEQTSEDLQHINAALNENKERRIQRRNQMEAIQETFGTSAEQQGFNSPALAGIETRKTRKGKKRVAVADTAKAMSETSELEQFEYNKSITRSKY